MKQFVTFILKFAFCALILAGIIKFVFFFPKTDEPISVTTAPVNPMSPPPDEPVETPKPPKPVDHTEIIIHPYDLVQNPFQHKNELITMDGREFPVILNGQVMSSYQQLNFNSYRTRVCGLKIQQNA